MASPLPTSGEASELERLRSLVSTYFPVYETRVGPQSVLFAVHIDPASLETRFDAMRRDLWTRRYVPILRKQAGEEFVEVIRRPTIKPFQGWVNILLLCGTIATTAFAGSLIWLAYVGGNSLGWIDVAYGTLFFGLPVMTILGLHELSHFLVARHHHVEASLPYFIPIPPPFLFGTFGAFISIREPFPDKKALFDIGAAGPLAGFAASIPIAIAGLYLGAHAPVLPLTYCGPTVLGVSYGNLLIGTPLFWYGLTLFFPASVVMNLSPLALAGWVGILVTAINLLPAGQLDGGHVFRALFGDRSRYLSYAVVVILFGIGLFYYIGWLFFGLLILFLGARHPPPLNDLSPLDVKRYAVGAFVVGILITGFVLTPIASPAGAISLPADQQLVTYPTPVGGAAIAANLSVTIVNQDPVPHGFLVATTVENVSVGNRSSPTYLTGAALAAWAANSTWVYRLPDGATVSLTGASVTLPTADYLRINATGNGNQATVVVAFSNSEPAIAAIVGWQTSEFCATTAGSASTTFSLVWA